MIRDQDDSRAKAEAAYERADRAYTKAVLTYGGFDVRTVAAYRRRQKAEQALHAILRRNPASKRSQLSSLNRRIAAAERAGMPVAYLMEQRDLLLLKRGKKHNPSSGAKQRARGSRGYYQQSLEGSGSPEQIRALIKAEQARLRKYEKGSLAYYDALGEIEGLKSEHRAAVYGRMSRAHAAGWGKKRNPVILTTEDEQALKDGFKFLVISPSGDFIRYCDTAADANRVALKFDGRVVDLRQRARSEKLFVRAGFPKDKPFRRMPSTTFENLEVGSVYMTPDGDVRKKTSDTGAWSYASKYPIEQASGSRVQEFRQMTGREERDRRLSALGASLGSLLSKRNPGLTPAGKKHLIQTMHKAGADTFKKKVAYVRRHIPNITDPQAFVGYVMAGERKGKRR